LLCHLASLEAQAAEAVPNRRLRHSIRPAGSR
jgi:hypothetical protein